MTSIKVDLLCKGKFCWKCEHIEYDPENFNVYCIIFGTKLVQPKNADNPLRCQKCLKNEVKSIKDWIRYLNIIFRRKNKK